MSEQRNGLYPDKLRAVNLLASSGSNRANTEDCGSEAVAGRLGGDPEFVAELNRFKAYQTERLRADVRSLASEAISTLRDLTRPGVPSSVRLRASLAVLQSLNGLKAEDSGPMSVEGVRAKMARERLFDALG
jgi:hypothetical protein